jgi:hypothetical protein
MAPVLLCPECGAKHPLDSVGSSAFPCKGCGRTLKVPQQVPAAAGVAAAPAADADLPWPHASVPPEPTSTRVVPTTTTPPPAPAAKRLPPKRRAASLDPVPARWLRFLLWLVAVPLGFVIVFALARAFGMLNSTQIEDVVITEGLSRFWPIARLLPFVALVTAGIVQASVFGITRLRSRRLGSRRERSLSARASG